MHKWTLTAYNAMRIIGGVLGMLNDEERKHKGDYEDKYMADGKGKNLDMVHVHMFTTEVDVADEHQHVLLGVSGPARMEGRSHVHQICTRTSFSCGHWHWVDIMTDCAVAMPNGTHTHYFAGRTSMNDDHCHHFADVTTLGPDRCLEEDDDEDEDCIFPPKDCKYKYKRPEDEEFN